MNYDPLTIDDYAAQFANGKAEHLLLDVRTEEEFEEVRMPGTVNIPLDEVPDRTDEIAELAGDKPVVLVCRTGVRSLMAAQILRQMGQLDLQLYNLEAGTVGWVRAGHPVER